MPDSFYTSKAVEDLRNVLAQRHVPAKSMQEVDGWSLFGGSLPDVEVPAEFRPYPLVIGSPEFARMADEMFNLMPQSRGQVNTVFQGPGGPTQRTWRNHVRKGNMSPELHRELLGDPSIMTNIAGTTTPMRGEVDVNTFPDEEKATLAHELSHSIGSLWERSSEKLARELEDLYNRIPGR